MDYQEYKPHIHLAEFIECYWYARSDRPPFREKESLIPDGTIEMMFNFGDDYFQVIENDLTKIKGSHVIGIRNRSLSISQPGKQHFFCIRFKLGGTYPFFRLPVDLFAGRFYSLDVLLGNQLKELEERLYNAKNNESRICIADQFFLQKLYTGNGDYLFIRKCLPFLVQSMDIGKTAKDFNTNYKTLERRFRKVVGLSPTELLKINRFNNAVLTMYACRYDNLTSIAYSSGYYDQSHFIREFKQLTGFTPKDFLKEQFTIVQVIQPALAERMSKSYNF
jgi:AraC-like DNA-binding protein